MTLPSQGAAVEGSDRSSGRCVGIVTFAARSGVVRAVRARGRPATSDRRLVAVRHPPPHETGQAITVVSPCGACRELIWDYDRNARVIVPGANGPETVAIGDLLPNKYSRERNL